MSREIAAHHHRSNLREFLFASAVWFACALVAAIFCWLLYDILRRGVFASNAPFSWSFLTTMPLNAGRAGGIAPILMSTALIVGVCIVVALPLGIGAAMFLAEQGRGDDPVARTNRAIIRGSLDALAAVPSIVFGLFGSVFFCQVLGMGYSILAGGLTLACMVLPIVIRTVEQGLRAVPDAYRHGAAALALSTWTTTWRVKVPAALPAIATGLVLGIGRAAAETAALIFTSGYVARVPASLYDSGRALSVHIYDLAMHIPGGSANAYASAAVLIIALLIINQTTWALMKRPQLLMLRW